MSGLKTGEVAKCASVGIETVRFYERQGLIEAPVRTAAGYRQYPPATVLRIRFIKGAQQAGFSLPEIKELLLLRVDSTTRCEDIRVRAEAKIQVIEEKIAALENVKGALVELTAACRGKSDISECPILAAFEQEENTL
jgi:MerR family mercuric resistance operon transcriptional regulator